MQASLPILGDVSAKITEIPWNEIAMCDTEQAAYRTCVRNDRCHRSHENIVKALNDLPEFAEMTPATFSRILNSDYHKERPRHAGRTFQIALQQICGNEAIEQWADLFKRGQLMCQRNKETEIEALRARLAELEAN